MIEGLKIDIPVDELREVLEGRQKYHEEKARWYAAREGDLKSGGAEFQEGYTSANPLGNLAQKRREHEGRAVFFRVLATHLIPGETYRLDEGDLTRIELSHHYFGA